MKERWKWEEEKKNGNRGWKKVEERKKKMEVRNERNREKVHI